MNIQTNELDDDHGRVYGERQSLDMMDPDATYCGSFKEQMRLARQAERWLRLRHDAHVNFRAGIHAHAQEGLHRRLANG